MKNNPATQRQTWAIFTLTRFDVRNCALTIDMASQVIDLAKNGKLAEAIALVSALPGVEKKGEAKPKQDWQAIYNEAHLAGMQAVNGFQPRPMVVQQHSDATNDNSPVTRQWIVNDGICGFYWVSIRPANSSFALWLKKNNLAKTDSYAGGVKIWVHQFNQSYERKGKYAEAFAKVLVAHGIHAYADGRLD